MNNVIVTFAALILPFFSFATISSISGSTNVCVGLTTYLTDATPGGSWSSGNPAHATVDSATGIVTGISAGTVMITYTTTIGYATATIVVNALPAVYTVSGGGSYCSGGSGVDIMLNGSNTGDSYQLYRGVTPIGTSVLGSGLPIDFGLQTSVGTYTVYGYSYGYGCQRAMSGSATIAVAGIPVISGPTTTCVGSGISLSAIPFGGAWSSSNPAVAAFDPTTGLIFGASTGTATIHYSLGTGCTSSYPITVNLSPSPISVAFDSLYHYLFC